MWTIVICVSSSKVLLFKVWTISTGHSVSMSCEVHFIFFYVFNVSMIFPNAFINIFCFNVIKLSKETYYY